MYRLMNGAAACRHTAGFLLACWRFSVVLRGSEFICSIFAHTQKTIVAAPTMARVFVAAAAATALAAAADASKPHIIMIVADGASHTRLAARAHTSQLLLC